MAVDYSDLGCARAYMQAGNWNAAWLALESARRRLGRKQAVIEGEFEVVSRVIRPG